MNHPRRNCRSLALALGLILVSSAVSLAQSTRLGAYEFWTSKGKHTARIVIRNELFEPTKHIVSYDRKKGNLVDGHEAHGVESVPRTQIKSIEFQFDRRKLKVPHWLFSDCYDPNLERRYVKLRFSRDSQRVFVTMWGADGAGAYGVVWILRANGKHARYFEDSF